MPEDDVADLRDVVDAINRLCDTMKTSYVEETYEDTEVIDNTPQYTECGRDAELVSPDDVAVRKVEVYNAVRWCDTTSQISQIEDVETVTSDTEPALAQCEELVSPSDVTVRKVEVYNAERWCDTTSQISQIEDVETVTSDTEPALAQCEPISEMYYTASSEVSLLSDLELPERTNEEDPLPDRESKEDRKECVIAGHVAAMRERFESMTRTNTPCPDLIRSMSPSLDVFRNITPSPDRLG